MRISSSVPRSLLLAGAFIGVLSYGAVAQTANPRRRRPPLPAGFRRVRR